MHIQSEPIQGNLVSGSGTGILLGIKKNQYFRGSMKPACVTISQSSFMSENAKLSPNLKQLES